jgi:hypothetical protein
LPERTIPVTIETRRKGRSHPGPEFHGRRAPVKTRHGKCGFGASSLATIFGSGGCDGFLGGSTGGGGFSAGFSTAFLPGDRTGGPAGRLASRSLPWFCRYRKRPPGAKALRRLGKLR